MAVGNQASVATVNQELSDIAVAMRNVLQRASNMSRWINGQGGGQASLVAMGFSSQDAAAVLTNLSYLNTVSALYFGDAAQPAPFNFNNQLSQLWAGQ